MYNRSIAAEDSCALERELFFGSFITVLKPIDFSIWDLAEEKSYDAIIEHGKTKSPAWKFKVWVKKD